MLVFIGGLGGINGRARNTGGFHDALDLLRIVGSAPFDDLPVQLLALFRGDGCGTGRAVLVVIVLDIKTHGRNAAFVYAGAEGAQSDQEAILGLEEVIRLEGGVEVAGAFGDLAGHGIGSIGAAHILCHRFKLGDVDDLALAGLLGIGVAGKCGEQGGKGRNIVVGVGLGDGRIAVGVTLQIQPAGEGLADHVVGGAVADIGQTAEFLVAHAGDMDDDQLRVDLEQLLVIDAQLVHPDHVLHENVGFFDETVEDLLDFFMLEVQLEAHSQLVAGILCPGSGDLRAVDIGKGSQHTKRIADTGALNLDDFCTEVGQHGSGKGHGHQGAGADNAHARKGTKLGDDEFTIAHNESPSTNCFVFRLFCF